MTTLGNAGRPRTPSGVPVAPQSYKSLEKIATQLSALLPKSHGNGSWRLDAWRILEQTLPRAGYRYNVADVSELSEVAAFTIPEKGLVVVREDVYEGLFREEVFSRSTIVHELSHIVLNHHITFHRGAVLGKHDFCRDSEWQAKALTAAVMMPIDACRAAYSAEELGHMCGTSTQASGYRLERLAKEGLIDPNRFREDLFQVTTQPGGQIMIPK